ncbi:iron-containing alcohol dehydrogenase [Hathewaya histolytica]|uniref:Iron-containing alcohol dehydrogenase n=1 Tax=Hathewaya histolytica TaxID=1498 RepID=A0A4U9QZ72_HATHI|nr:iron-containing alcohol dehydrogenase [Hathewaya histolytica]VTQ83458.1 iron-containing alcohol dehydrogenase [Hathewaya histolytica]
MENFIFKNPTKLIFGKDTIKNIGEELKKDSIEKVMLVYGKGSIFKNGVYDAVIKSLKDNNLNFVELSGVKPNPVLSKVKEAIAFGKENNIDALLPIGGGSVYDTCKAIAAGFYYGGDVWDFFEGTQKTLEKTLPIYGILTISATGSEMNSGGVITNEEEQKKWSFGHELLYPKVSVVDPSIQCSLPKNQTINGTIDTMTHVFEYYFDGIKNVDLMQEYCEGIIRTAMKHGEILMTDPENYNSRAELALSATLALNRTTGMGRCGGDWATHQIEHSVSALYDISHGAGLAIIFPAWAKYVYKHNLETFSRFGERIFNITEGTNEEKALKGIDELMNFYKKLGAPVSLKEIGVTEDALEKIADNAAMSCPFGFLKNLEREDVLEILKLAYF